jgi:peptidoglycan/LPS O-acetylase OafA/YrhL
MWIYYPTYNRLDGLLFGAAIAAVRRLRPGWWDVVSRQDRWILAASAASLAAAVVICRERFSFAGSVFGFALVSAGFALLVLAALCPASALARVKIPGARQGAALSYSLYLTHKGVIHLVHPRLTALGFDPRGTASFAATAAACLAVSASVYWLIERPSLRLRDRLLGRLGRA